MKRNAALQDINVYHKKDRRFWYLQCNVSTVDDNAIGCANDAIGADDDNRDGGNGITSRLIRAASHLPLWGGRKYSKKVDALRDAMSWRGVVCEVLLSQDYCLVNEADPRFYNAAAIANNDPTNAHADVDATATYATTNDTAEVNGFDITAEEDGYVRDTPQELHAEDDRVSSRHHSPLVASACEDIAPAWCPSHHATSVHDGIERFVGTTDAQQRGQHWRQQRQQQHQLQQHHATVAIANNESTNAYADAYATATHAPTNDTAEDNDFDIAAGEDGYFSHIQRECHAEDDRMSSRHHCPLVCSASEDIAPAGRASHHATSINDGVERFVDTSDVQRRGQHRHQQHQQQHQLQHHQHEINHQALENERPRRQHEDEFIDGGVDSTNDGGCQDAQEFHFEVLKAMLEDQDVKVTLLTQQLEESERKVTCFRQRLDEALAKVSTLELRLNERDLNTIGLASVQPQGTPTGGDPVATDEDMHDFIYALNSTAVLEHAPTKRVRTSPFPCTTMPVGGAREAKEQQEISRLQLELRQCMREKEEAKALAMKAHTVGIQRKKACHIARCVRRGTKPSSAQRGSPTYMRWFNRQVDAVSSFIANHFGASIFSLRSSNDNDAGETSIDVSLDDSNVFEIRVLGEILAAFTKKHEGLLEVLLDAVSEQRGVNSYKLRLKEVEKAAVDAMEVQLTPVAILLLAHLGVSHAGYQTLINATSWATGDGDTRASRVRCPLGTPLCRWPPLHRILREIESTASKLGLTNMGKGAARMDIKKVLIDQLLFLFKSGLLNLEEGVTIWVQILGDATGIWRSLKMNGTTIVLKVLF